MAARFDSAEAALDASQKLLGLSYLPRALQIVSGGKGPWLGQFGANGTDEALLVVEHAGGGQAVGAKLAESRSLLSQQGEVQEGSTERCGRPFAIWDGQTLIRVTWCCER